MEGRVREKNGEGVEDVGEVGGYEESSRKEDNDEYEKVESG